MSFDNDQLVEKIKSMDKDEAVEILLSILSTSKNMESKIKAVELLIQFDDSNNTHFQTIKDTFLNDRHPQLRLQLIKLIGTYYKEKGIDFLKEQYKNCSDGTVRKNLIDIVGKVDLNASLSFLVEALNDANMEAKKIAITNLGKISASEALIPLINMLHFRNTEIYDSLINAIVKIGKKGNLEIIYDYIDTEDPHIKREIPIILGKIGSKESAAVLIDFLKDDNPIIRKNSIKALDGIIELRNVKHVIDLLTDQDIEVRKEVIRVLGNVRSKRAINPLIESLKENDAKIRNLAKNALYKILEKTKSYEPLFEVVKGRNINARREAVNVKRCCCY